MSISNPTLHQMHEELFVSEEFVERYNRPGPRYTSYPTAPVWKDSFGPTDYQAAIEEAEHQVSPVSLYMHLPFCESLCLFCACSVIIRKDKSATPPYLATLKKEIDHISRGVSNSRPVTQFHWGGGTPTYLSPPQMEELFTYTRERFNFAPDAEIGIEVDPRVTSLCHTVIVKDEISRKFGIDFDEYFAPELDGLKMPQEDGLVVVDSTEIHTTWLGRIFIRNLAMVFDPYLEKQQLAARPLFSKTL